MSMWAAVKILATCWYLFYHCDKCGYKINSKDNHRLIKEGSKCPRCGDGVA